ncbi:MAG: efflux RND transporter periplasmic adaptor subunit, partial [Bdellovibrionota bacterium]
MKQQDRDESSVVVNLKTPSATATPHWSHEILAILKSKTGMRILGGLAVVVVLRVGSNLFFHRHHDAALSGVEVAHPATREMDTRLNLPGNIEAIEQASLYAHVSGYLKKIYVDEGDKVKEGQLLAEIDSPEVTQEYRKAKANYDLKSVTRKRYDELLKEKVVSQQEFDTIDADSNEAQARFDNAAANLEFTHVRAPFSGSLARRFKYPGDLITAATQSKGENPLFILVNESQLRVAVSVPQIDVASIHVGHPADVSVDALPGQVIHGKVSRLDALLDEGTKTQRVLIDVDNRDRKLRAGMFASVSLHLQHKDRALVIPREALRMEGDQPVVYQIKERKIHRQPVVIGISDSTGVEVTQGLAESDSVVVRGAAALIEGTEVEV